MEANRGQNGGIVINRGSRGERTVVSGRPGNRVVSYGPRRGFVERSVRPGYISRTYAGGGRHYAHVYREYRYRNFLYYRYVPAVYYGPRFYTWILTPWSMPVRYTWFGAARPAPWFGFYAGYFTPYPTYASPSLWLTDFVLAENLRIAYESQTSPRLASSPNETKISAEIKALIADEVQQQLAAERQPDQAKITGEPLPPALTQRFFVVSSDFEVMAAGQTCSLTPGDIVQRKGREIFPDGTVAAEVVTSKAGNCSADSAIAIGVAELQEMQNQFREQIDSGLKMMAENREKRFLDVPAADARTNAEGVADPAADAEAQLAAQEIDAAELEAQVRQGGN